MEKKNTLQVSRFTRRVRLEWKTRSVTTERGQTSFRVYRLWVGNTLVRKYLSYTTAEHDEVVSQFWREALDYLVKKDYAIRVLDLPDLRAFIMQPVDPTRLYDMDEEDFDDRRTFGEDGSNTGTVH